MLFQVQDSHLNQLWVEKFRPKTLNDLVLNDDQKIFMVKCLEGGEIPHLAFFGPPGSGKTTLARILIESLVKSDMDALVMNGSDSTGVESMRTTVLSFLKSPPFKSKFKIVYIDEFDYVTQNAQAILRSIMETYADNGRFIVTGNYMSKIIEPLFSRFTLFEMKSVQKEFVVNYAKEILKSENVEYDDNSVDLIVQNFLPDVRKAINTLQKNTSNGKLKKIDVNTIITNENRICGLIVQLCDDIPTERKEVTINNCVPQILTLLNNESEPDYHHIYQCLAFHEKLPLWAKIKVNYYNNYHNSCASPPQHFMAMVYDIIHAGMVYYEMFAKKK
jgi:DNA polymerase III gamma/tau subunit